MKACRDQLSVMVWLSRTVSNGYMQFAGYSRPICALSTNAPVTVGNSDGVLMVLRVWKGLVLAAYFNLQSRLYYELLGNFMGKGDKETFALGLSVAGLPYHVIATPVGSVGFNQYPFGYAVSMRSSCDS